MVARTDNVLMLVATGGGGVRRVPCSDVRVNWEVSRSGTLIAFVEARTAIEAGLRDCEGMWIGWVHPTLGPWDGVIVAPRWRPGQLEIAAEGWLTALLRKRLTRRSFQTVTAPAGALMLKALHDAAAESPLWLTEMEADEHGEFVRWEWRFDDIHDQVLSRLLRSGEFEAEITNDRAFRFRRRIGTDKSHMVHLVEGLHISDFRYASDLWGAENDIIGVGADSTFVRAGTFRAQDDASIAQYDRRQGVRTFTGQMSRSAVAPMTRQALAESKDPTRTLELTLTGDDDDVWRAFREGDTVRVSLPSADRILRARVMVRAYDGPNNALQLSADVDEVLR